MAIDQLTEQRTVDTSQYEVVQKHEELGIIIVRNSEGGFELWERFEGYQGESMIVDGKRYRFLRLWRGAPKDN